MSLPLIAETAAEVHRLAIAGSSLASGDYRLLRILPQLESLGVKAPVFARIAQGVKSVTGEPDAAVAGRALLDLATVLTAIQYTQSPHGADGEFEPLHSDVKEWTPTVAGYRSLSAVVEALTSTGQGRLEVVKDARQRGLFKDLRLLTPAIGALGDKFGELADYVAGHCIPQFGPVIAPLLLEGFDPKGGKSHARRVAAFCLLNPEAGRALCRQVLPDTTKEVKLAVIEGLTGSEADLDTMIELTKERSEDVRHAAIRALKGIKHTSAAGTLRSLFEGKDGAVALAAAASADEHALPEDAFQQACALIAGAKKGGDESAGKHRDYLLLAVLRSCIGKKDPNTRELLRRLFEARAEVNSWQLSAVTAQLMYELNDAEVDEALYSALKTLRHWDIMWAFLAACRRLPPPTHLKLFRDSFRKNGERSNLNKLLSGLPIQCDLRNDWPVLGAGLNLDPGWLAEAISAGNLPVVAFLARKGDLAASKLLLEKLKGSMDDRLRYDCEAAIFRIDPECIGGYVSGKLKAIEKKKGRGYEVVYILRRIPDDFSSELDAISRLGEGLTGERREVFDSHLAELRHKAAASTAGAAE